MVSQPAPCESPATSRIFSRTHLTFALNSKCHEPASCSIACFTDRLVVSGPGVNSSLSRAPGNVAEDFIKPGLNGHPCWRGKDQAPRRPVCQAGRTAGRTL